MMARRAGALRRNASEGSDSFLPLARALTTPPRQRCDTGTVGRRVGSVKRLTDQCCCNVKMSSPNCSVKRSSLNGDLHVEPEGTASAGAVEGAVWRAADGWPRGGRPPR